MKNLCIIHRGGDKGPCFLDSLARGRACTSFIGGGGRGCFVGSLGREESLFIIHRGGERGCFLDSLARERRACASFIGEGKEIVLWAHLGGKTSLCIIHRGGGGEEVVFWLTWEGRRACVALTVEGKISCFLDSLGRGSCFLERDTYVALTGKV